jgi:hypothetical protein
MMVLHCIFLTLALLTSRSYAATPTANTNLASAQVFDRSLADVRAAVETYCRERGPGHVLATPAEKNPDASYSLSISDCGPPRPATFWMGDMLVTSLSPQTTRLEVRTRFCNTVNGLSVNPATNAVVTDFYVKKVSEILDRKR